MRRRTIGGDRNGFRTDLPRLARHWMIVVALGCALPWIAGCQGQPAETRRPNPERVEALTQDFDSGTWN